MLTCSSRNTLARSFVYQVGKSTLVRSLVRHYTRQNVNEVQGPITVVSGKRRRLTLIECPNDISSMMDVAKVADLVLLMIDAHYGFEMETFEFLNILQVHGFPKVMGVLSHLDLFKSTKLVARKKKELKQRFWTEIYQVRRCLLVCAPLARGQTPLTLLSAAAAAASGATAGIEAVLSLGCRLQQVVHQGRYDEHCSLHFGHEVPSVAMALGASVLYCRPSRGLDTSAAVR